jgi:hypothetical protein
MANPNRPTGLSPIGCIGASGTDFPANLYAIANDASNTYAIGDVVKTAAGCDVMGVPLVTKAASGDVPVGIIVGFRISDPGVSLVGSNLNLNILYLSKNSGTRYVMVADDPDVIFEVQMDSTAITLANLHKNSNLTITADDTTALAANGGMSSTVLTGSTVNTTNTFIVRMLGLIQRDDNQITSSTVAGAYCRVRAKFNAHEYSTTTGFTAA